MIKPKKSLGQNFLVDLQVVSNLIEAAQISQKDTVLEVGAGTGIVTQELTKKAEKVVAVEFDKDLIPTLEKNLEGAKNVGIINEDILKVPLNDHLPQDYKVVGSIPYQITSPLIHKLLKLESLPQVVVLVVQKEVAEKIAAEPPKATYLSNFTVAFGKAEIQGLIKPQAFNPPPRVDSALIKIEPFKGRKVKDIESFESFLHKGFQYPRKMIRSQFPKKTLEKVGINPQSRPENLDFNQWKELFKETTSLE